jgi:hypothetical protein
MPVRRLLASGIRWDSAEKPGEKGGAIRFLTKFIVVGVQKKWAATFRMDFEADSPKHAADLASDYWHASWNAPESVTEAVIHVHRYLPNSKEINEEPVLVVPWSKTL